MHTKDKGDIAEQFVIAHCLKRGWTVLKPIGDNKPYDIVIDKGDGEFHTVQIKWGRYERGKIAIDAKSSGYTFDGGGNRILFNKAYSPDKIDYIASYCPETNECYIVENDGQKQVNLRVEKSKNNQSLNVRWAKDHIL